MNNNVGLKINDAESILLRYRDRYQLNSRIIAGAVAGLASIVYLVATPLLTRYLIPDNPIPSPTGDYWLTADGLHKPHMIKSGLPFAALLFAIVIPVTTVGFVALGIYRLIDRYIIQKKVDALSKYILGLTANYEPFVCVDTDYIHSVFTKADQRAKVELLGRMNFEQLKAARSFVRAGTFANAVEATNDQIWSCALATYKSCKTPDELTKQITILKGRCTVVDFSKLISALKDLYADNSTLLKVINQEISLPDLNFDQSILLNRRPTPDTWESLWHQAVLHRSGTMQIKLRTYAIEQLDQALKNPTEPTQTSLWLSRMLVSSNPSQYGVVVDEHNFQMAFQVGQYLRKHYNHKEICDEVMAYCKDNSQKARNCLTGDLNSIPEEITNVLYSNESINREEW